MRLRAALGDSTGDARPGTQMARRPLYLRDRGENGERLASRDRESVQDRPLGRFSGHGSPATGWLQRGRGVLDSPAARLPVFIGRPARRKSSGAVGQGSLFERWPARAHRGRRAVWAVARTFPCSESTARQRRRPRRGVRALSVLDRPGDRLRRAARQQVRAAIRGAQHCSTHPRGHRRLRRAWQLHPGARDLERVAHGGHRSG